MWWERNEEFVSLSLWWDVGKCQIRHFCQQYTAGMGNFNDREGHKNVILTNWGPDCNCALPPVGYCNPIIQLANLTETKHSHSWVIYKYFSAMVSQTLSLNKNTGRKCNNNDKKTIFMFNVHFYSLPSHSTEVSYSCHDICATSVKEQWEKLSTEKYILLI